MEESSWDRPPFSFFVFSWNLYFARESESTYSTVLVLSSGYDMGYARTVECSNSQLLEPATSPRGVENRRSSTPSINLHLRKIKNAN